MVEGAPGAAVMTLNSARTKASRLIPAGTCRSAFAAEGGQLLAAAAASAVASGVTHLTAVTLTSIGSRKAVQG